MGVEYRFSDVVTIDNDNIRLDKYLATRISSYSRVQLRTAITAGEVLVDGKTAKPAYKLRAGQTINCQLSAPSIEIPEPENIPLDIIFEDEHLVAINKPAQMVVHPAKGHWKGTLVSALSYHFRSLSNLGGLHRPGIVHRLDRDTTGVIVIAKTDIAHQAIARQFEQRTTIKEYHCLTLGIPDRDRDIIDEPIGPHPYQRERMAIRHDHPKARSAQSFFEVVERFRHIALLKITPKTGRTHQIRVHLTHLGYPILADKLYGGIHPVTKSFLETGRNSDDDHKDIILTRQALHAASLTLTHPMTGNTLVFQAPYSEDFELSLKILRG
ncbi:MAG: RNA pseudouridine synthase [Planctomycetaceae bacterium]|nr:RNA pseudouridine synthase [Planctomycetaceae bacterium]|tara:strand:- start:383 stop:1360 length:978 start_codon:yes stop_codon:yes gene_type:complete